MRKLSGYFSIMTFSLSTLLLSGCGALDLHMKSLTGKSYVLSLEQPVLTVSEGDLLDLGVSLSAAREVPTVVSISLTSTRNDQALDFDQLPPLTLTIPAGSLSARFSMRLANDTLYEGRESFGVLISSSDGAVTTAPSSFTLWVDDDNAPPTVSFTLSTSTTREGVASQALGVDLSGPSEIPTVVSYSVSGTALYLVDHSLADGTVTIAAGATHADLAVALINDTTPEASKSIEVTLDDSDQATIGSTPTHVLTLQDNDLGVVIRQAALQTDPAITLPVVFEIAFSQAIDPSTLDVTDFTQSGTATGVTWNLASASVTNDLFELSATAISGDGTLVPSLAAAIIETPAGDLSQASTSTDNSVLYDSIQPTVTINRVSSVPHAVSALPSTAVFDVVFSEAIAPASFTSADLVQDGTSTGLAWTIVNSGNAKNFTLILTSATDGSIVPSIAAGAVTDVAGNGNLASTVTDNYLIKGLAVVPAYTLTGKNWNDYVQNDGLKYFNATGTACVGSEDHYTKCRHAGEIRKIVLPGVTSCSGITASDSLGAFTWDTCEVVDGLATFFTRQLNDGKGLRDLIESDGSAWKSNSVSFTGTYTATSASTRWWANPLVAVPANVGVANTMMPLTSAATVGTIYYASSSQNTNGYSLANDKTALVTLAGSTLSYAGEPGANCSATTGATSGADRCVIAISGRKFLWIEVILNGEGGTNDAVNGIVIGSSSFVTLQNSESKNSHFNIVDSLSLRVKNFKANIWSAMSVVRSNGNIFQNIQLARQTLALRGASRNVISHVTSTGNYAGIDIGTEGGVFATDNVVLAVATMGSNNGVGYQVQGARTVVGFTTLGNNTGFGLGNWAGSMTVHNLVAVNSTSKGLEIAGGVTDSAISHLVTAHSGDKPLYVSVDATPYYRKFSGNLLIGNNGNPTCVDTSTAYHGINAACVGIGLSAGLLNTVTGISLATSFVGPVVTDSVNTSDTGASLSFPTLNNDINADWLHFQNPYRVWAYYTQWHNQVHANQVQAWWGGDGRIWDWTLRSTDTVLRNRTGNGTTANSPFIDGATCPTEVAGSVTTTDLYDGETMGDGVGNENGACDGGETCGPRTFLLNAMEIIDDEVGNDNGLCESGDACIYTPNYGAYQGHGDYKAHTCTFADGVGAGTVSGVKMYAYPVNGN